MQKQWRKQEDEAEQTISQLKVQLKQKVPVLSSVPRAASVVPGSETKLFPMKYDGSTDFEAYKQQFDRIAESRGWSVREQSTVLISRLKGKALEAANVAVNQTYPDLISALKKRFSPDVEAIWKTKLKSRKQQPNEELVELHAEIRKLVARAHPGVGDEGVRSIARDHFISAIADPELSRRVNNHLPKTLDEALEISEALWANLQLEREADRRVPEKKSQVKTVKAVKSSSSDEESGDPVVRQLLERFSKLENKLQSKQRPKQNKSPRKQRFRKPEFDRKKQNPSRPVECYNCGYEGHVQRYCPFEKLNKQKTTSGGPQLTPKRRSSPEQGN
jgi:hypothetical protein